MVTSTTWWALICTSSTCSSPEWVFKLPVDPDINVNDIANGPFYCQFLLFPGYYAALICMVALVPCFEGLCWSMANGQWSMVNEQWSMLVNGQWSCLWVPHTTCCNVNIAPYLAVRLTFTYDLNRCPLEFKKTQSWIFFSSKKNVKLNLNSHLLVWLGEAFTYGINYLKKN